MRLAVVAGGWHWPLHFFASVSKQAGAADLFAVGHRSPDLPVVREEKRAILEALPGELGRVDRELYGRYADTAWLHRLGWRYREEPNTVGDWGFFNQWLETHDYRNYDLILFCHDDTYFRPRTDLFKFLAAVASSSDWLIVSHSKYPEAPQGYLRGSFEFWTPQMLDLLGGKIDLGRLGMTRMGQSDTPVGMEALSSWNATCDPLRRFMRERKLTDRIAYLSNHYRISPWAIEGERGFVSMQGGAPWSFEAGLQAYPLPNTNADSPVSRHANTEGSSGIQDRGGAE